MVKVNAKIADGRVSINKNDQFFRFKQSIDLGKIIVLLKIPEEKKNIFEITLLWFNLNALTVNQGLIGNMKLRVGT